MDALDSQRDGDDDDDDDCDYIINGRGSPKEVGDCDAQRDPTLAENVGV